MCPNVRLFEPAHFREFGSSFQLYLDLLCKLFQLSQCMSNIITFTIPFCKDEAHNRKRGISGGKWRKPSAVFGRSPYLGHFEII